ncbi:MAG: hypothetical protein RMK49_21510 [Abditibacteriales bacterium]|nr:hypothetical protein [Abditibacteriales bacterium]
MTGHPEQVRDLKSDGCARLSEAAEMAGVSPTALRPADHSGKLKPLKDLAAPSLRYHCQPSPAAAIAVAAR